MEEVKIMGVDPSLRSTGLAVLSGDSASWGHLRYSKDATRAMILTSTMNYFRQAPEPGRWIVGVEGYSFGKNSSAGFTPTVEVGGTVKAAVGRWARWIEVPPQSWKWAIIGRECLQAKKGTIGKNRNYIEIICRSLGFEAAVFESTDEADAYCIALYVRRLIDGEIKLAKTSETMRAQFKQLMEE
jgi:Holliday junction resolvasome RuvABC endonuclease subunit